MVAERAKGWGDKPERNQALLARWKTGGASYGDLAKEFGISRQCAYQIVQRFKDREEYDAAVG